jgi:hypothetical protein
MKLKDIVYKIGNGKIIELIVVSTVDTKSIHPYGLTNTKFGVCSKNEFETERKNSGVSRQDNPLPYVKFYEEKELFTSKELLIESIK